jgi:outer membrane protein assembly factor BamB
MQDIVRTLRVSLLLVVTVVGSRVVGGETWPRFRGDNGSGVSTSRGLPTDFGPDKHVLWKIDASHGSSSPIISQGLLYFSSYDGDQRTLHCLDATTGKERWARSVKKLRQEPATPPNGPATPTPAIEGDSVFMKSGVSSSRHFGACTASRVLWSRSTTS